MTVQPTIPDTLMNLWAAEWSPKQKAFHVHTLQDMLAENNRTFAEGGGEDFIPLAICRTSEDASAYIKEVEKIRPRG